MGLTLNVQATIEKETSKKDIKLTFLHLIKGNVTVCKKLTITLFLQFLTF